MYHRTVSEMLCSNQQLTAWPKTAQFSYPSCTDM